MMQTAPVGKQRRAGRRGAPAKGGSLVLSARCGAGRGAGGVWCGGRAGRGTAAHLEPALHVLVQGHLVSPQRCPPRAQGPEDPPAAHRALVRPALPAPLRLGGWREALDDQVDAPAAVRRERISHPLLFRECWLRLACNVAWAVDARVGSRRVKRSGGRSGGGGMLVGWTSGRRLRRASRGRDGGYRLVSEIGSGGCVGGVCCEVERSGAVGRGGMN